MIEIEMKVPARRRVDDVQVQMSCAALFELCAFKCYTVGGELAEGFCAFQEGVVAGNDRQLFGSKVGVRWNSKPSEHN